MRIKHIVIAILALTILTAGLLFFAYPRGLSLILSFKKECKVMRVEPFMKGLIMNSPGQQMNKFSVACDDGSICRAEDTGFAAVKAGDVIVFRGFPEFDSFEQMGKCDHAQLIKILSEAKPGN